MLKWISIADILLQSGVENTNAKGAEMTNWESLETAETHMLLKFSNAAKNSTGEICERKGIYTLWAWKNDTPSRKTSRDVSKAQAIELAAKMRATAGNSIIFDKGAI